MKNLGFKILIIGLSLLGLFVLGVIGISFLLGHEAQRYCPIKIENKRNEELIIKTSQYTLKYDSYNDTLYLQLDTIYLKPNESFILGGCFDCSLIDTTSLDINTIELLEPTTIIKLDRKKEILDFLETKDKVDCATYLIN